MKDTYVAAVHHYIDTGMAPDALLSALQRVMAARGHQQLLPAVLRTVVRERSASRSVRTVVRVANQASYEQLQTDISESLAHLQATEAPAVVSDERLIGGYQVEAGYQRIDASYKQQLQTLYRNITNHPTT